MRSAVANGIPVRETIVGTTSRWAAVGALGLALLVAMFTGPVSAQDAAIRELMEKADRVDTRAQIWLGTRCKEGKRVTQDYGEALELYRKAAEKGERSAYNNHGLMCREGLGMPKNLEEAIKWFTMADLAGDQDAQYFLKAMAASPLPSGTEEKAKQQKQEPQATRAESPASAEQAARVHKEAFEMSKKAKTREDFRQVLQKYQEALAMAEGAKNEKGIASLSLNIGLTYRKLDDPDNAVEFLKRASRIAEKLKEEKIQYGALAELGRVHSALGEYEKAIRSARKSLDKAQAIHDPKLELSSLNLLGGIYSEAGMPEKATETLNAALEQAKNANDARAEARILNRLGRVRTVLGQYSKAQEQFEKALELAEKNQDAAEHVRALNNLGSCYSLRGNTKASYAYHKKAHELAVREKDASGIRETEYYLARLFLVASKYSEAIKILQRIQDQAVKSGNLAQQASALNQLGKTYNAWSRFEQAQDCFDRALRINETRKKPRGQADSLMGLARLFGDTGQADKALEYTLRVRAIAEELGDARMKADTILLLGHCYRARGNYKMAEEQYRFVADFAEKAGADLLQASALEGLAGICQARGQYKKAADYLGQYSNMRSKAGNVAGIRSAHMAMGSLFASIGNVKRSVKLYEKALAMARQVGDVRGEAQAFLALARAYSSWGRYDQAFEYFEKALHVARETGLPVIEADSLLGLGDSLAACGQYNKAIECLSKSLEIAKNTGHLSGQGACLGSIGNLYKTQGEYEKAITHYQQALEILGKLGKPTLMATSLIADCYLDMGDVAKAAAVDLGAKDPSGDPSVSSRLVSTLFLARLSLMKGDDAKAEQDYLKVLKEAEKSRRVGSLFAVYTGLGLVHEERKDYSGAAEYFRKATEVTEQIRAGLRKDEVGEFYSVKRLGFFRTAPYEGLARVLFRSGQFEESLKVSEYTKARTFAEALSRTGEGATFDLPAEVLQADSEINEQLASLVKEEQTAYEKDNQELVEALKPQLADLREKFAAHVRMLRKDYPLFAATKYPQPMELRQAALKGDEYALVYDVSDSGILIYLIKGHAVVKAVFRSMPREELSVLVRKFRDPLEIQPGRDRVSDKLKAFDFATGRRLAGVLLDEIIAQVPEGSPLLIIPDDVLGTLPFEMLPMTSGGEVRTDRNPHYVTGAKFLADRNPLYYDQSLTALTLARILSHRQAPQDNRLLVFADPVFQMRDQRAQQVRSTSVARSGSEKRYGDLMVAMEEAGGGAGTFLRLPLTGELAQKLRTMYGNHADVFTGMEASKEKFLKEVAPALGRYRSIVFATHGYFGTKIPGIMEPVLILNTLPLGTDGFLRMSEVMGLKMNADVVALTACQSGLGKVLSGEGTMGMGRAFQYAGGKSVLMSLWSVADISSVRLVEEFFKLVKEGNGKLDALQKARTTIRKEGYDHPFFWAAFILVGQSN